MGMFYIKKFCDAIAFWYGWTPHHPCLWEVFLCWPFTSLSFVGFSVMNTWFYSQYVVSSLLQCTNWATPSPIFRWNSVLQMSVIMIFLLGFFEYFPWVGLFDMRVFNPLDKNCTNQSLSYSYLKNKMHEYEGRVHNFEHGTFTPLVLSAAGGMGPIATTFTDD